MVSSIFHHPIPPPCTHAAVCSLACSLANEILSDLLEGSCKELDGVVEGLAAASVREGVS